MRDRQERAARRARRDRPGSAAAESAWKTADCRGAGPRRARRRRRWSATASSTQWHDRRPRGAAGLRLRRRVRARRSHLPTIGSIAGFIGRRKDQRRLLRVHVLHLSDGASIATISRPAQLASSVSRRWTSPRRTSRRRRSSTRRRTARRSRCSSPYRKGLKRDGKNPTYLYGYGGFNISLTPAFSPAHGRLDGDGRASSPSPNLRGGGEYGKAWHDAGRLDAQAERLRRLHRGRRVPDRRAVHVDAEAGDRRRQQRRPAGRRVR